MTRDGYRIDGNPTVGSIAQSDAGYYGHVAFVERVNSNGSILVSEMNFSASPGILTYRTIHLIKYAIINLFINLSKS